MGQQTRPLTHFESMKAHQKAYKDSTLTMWKKHSILGTILMWVVILRPASKASLRGFGCKKRRAYVRNEFK